MWCYDNSKVQSAFVKILLVSSDHSPRPRARLIGRCAEQTLFNADVLSSQAIIYWHNKGSKPQGRQQFLKASEPLVKKLQEQEDEESEDE